MGLKDVGVKLVVEGAEKFQSQMQSANQSISGYGATISKNSKVAGASMAAAGTAIVAGGASFNKLEFLIIE